ARPGSASRGGGCFQCHFTMTAPQKTSGVLPKRRKQDYKKNNLWPTCQRTKQNVEAKKKEKKKKTRKRYNPQMRIDTKKSRLAREADPKNALHSKETAPNGGALSATVH